MNFDGLTQALRERWLGRGRTTNHEEDEAQHNRASLRRRGIQGRTGAIFFKDGLVQGNARGSFLGAQARPSILVSNAPGWENRMLAKVIRRRGKNTRVRRTIQRMRANGEEVSA